MAYNDECVRRQTRKSYNGIVATNFMSWMEVTLNILDFTPSENENARIKQTRIRRKNN